MGQFRDVLLLLNRLKAEGVIHDYAVGGAVAVSLWTEPVATQRGPTHPDGENAPLVCARLTWWTTLC